MVYDLYCDLNAVSKYQFGVFCLFVCFLENAFGALESGRLGRDGFASFYEQ